MSILGEESLIDKVVILDPSEGPAPSAHFVIHNNTDLDHLSSV